MSSKYDDLTKSQVVALLKGEMKQSDWLMSQLRVLSAELYKAQRKNLLFRRSVNSALCIAASERPDPYEQLFEIIEELW